MNLIVLYGPPAVGKLTVARSLSALTGYGVLHNHLTFDLVRTIYAPRDARFFPLNAALRLRIIREAVEQRCPGLILTCIFAANSENDAKFVREMRRTVSRHKGTVHFVRLHCEPVELERRVTRADRKAAGKQADVEMLRAYLERWDVLGAIPNAASLVLDTTHLPPDETAQLIAGQFELVPLASVDDISSASIPKPQ